MPKDSLSECSLFAPGASGLVISYLCRSYRRRGRRLFLHVRQSIWKGYAAVGRNTLTFTSYFQGYYDFLVPTILKKKISFEKYRICALLTWRELSQLKLSSLLPLAKSAKHKLTTLMCWPFRRRSPPAYWIIFSYSFPAFVIFGEIVTCWWIGSSLELTYYITRVSK